MMERMMDSLSAVTTAAQTMMERVTVVNLAGVLAEMKVRMMDCLSAVMTGEMMVKLMDC